MADFIPHKEKQINATSFSTLCSEGVAGLIPYEDKLAMISHSTKCSEGVADLVQILLLVSDLWPCLVSDSRILVSDSQFLVSDSQFLIRGVLYLIPVL